MVVEEKGKKVSAHGGVREGSGRKKEAPEGAKQTTFLLSSEERAEVKKYIENMRRGKRGEEPINLLKAEVLKEALLKQNTMMFKEIIRCAGGKKCFLELEKYAKTMAIIAFKDAVCQYESEIELRRMEIEAEKQRLQEMAPANRLPK